MSVHLSLRLSYFWISTAPEHFCATVVFDAPPPNPFLIVVADMAADMEVHMVADMKVDKVTDMVSGHPIWQEEEGYPSIQAIPRTANQSLMSLDGESPEFQKGFWHIKLWFDTTSKINQSILMPEFYVGQSPLNHIFHRV